MYVCSTVACMDWLDRGGGQAGMHARNLYVGALCCCCIWQPMQAAIALLRNSVQPELSCIDTLLEPPCGRAEWEDNRYTAEGGAPKMSVSQLCRAGAITSCPPGGLSGALDCLVVGSPERRPTQQCCDNPVMMTSSPCLEMHIVDSRTCNRLYKRMQVQQL